MGIHKGWCSGPHSFLIHQGIVRKGAVTLLVVLGTAWRFGRSLLRDIAVEKVKDDPIVSHPMLG
jgi:hypothetical protein